MVKKTLIIGICMMMICLMSVSAEYLYFNSTSGSDSNDCLNTATACKTTTKINTNSSAQNRTFYLNSCEEPFRGFIRNQFNNWTLTSYGNCGKAKIYGSINASASTYWTSVGGNMWETQANFTYQVNSSFYNTSGNVVLMMQNTNGTLTTNWQFYWNSTSSKVKVYLDTGNPGSNGSGIEIPKYNYTSQNALIYIYTVDKATIRNIEISYSRARTIYFYTNQNSTIDNVTFKYNYDKVIYEDQGNNITISNNNFYKSGIRGTSEPYGRGGQGENVFVSTARNIFIINNTIQKCGGVCINPVMTSNLTITSNNVFDSEQDYLDSGNWAAGIYLDGCNNSIVRYNNVSDTEIGLAVGSEGTNPNSFNNTFEYNLIVGSKVSDFIIDTTSAGVKILNTTINQNTFYKNSNYTGSAYGRQIHFQNYNGVIFKNNLILNNYTNTTHGYLFYMQNGSTGGNLTSSYNFYNSTIGRNNFTNSVTYYGSLILWQALGLETNSQAGNPSFDLTTYRPSGTACTMSSLGSYVGAVPCADSPPQVHIISPTNGTITQDTTPTFTFNFTSSVNSTANCSLYLDYYQENASWSNGFEGVYDYTCNRWCDGNFSTGASLLNEKNFTFNYSKPVNVSSAIWKIKTASYSYIENITIPDSCFNAFSDQLLLNIYKGDAYSPTNWTCFNGVDWEIIALSRSYSVYEEAVEWLGILAGTNTSVINNTNTNLTSFSLLDTSHLGYVTCDASSSSYVSFSVATNPYIIISNPVSGSNVSVNFINISYGLFGNASDMDSNYYFNISLLNGSGVFNKTIQGNNSKNLSYYWNNILSGYSPGSYIIRVDGINSSGTIFATSNVSYFIATDAILNVTAYGNGSSLSNFTITMSPGGVNVVTSGVLLVGIFKNYTYNVTISDSGYAMTTVSGNWSNATNYLVFNLSALANSLIITFKDQDNLSVLSGVSIFLDVIGDGFADNYSTSTGYLNVSGLLVDNYTLRYGSTTYSVRFYSVEVSDQSTQNITLYLVLSSVSSNVTVTVIDQNANPVSGAVVKALKYDLASNSYLLQEVGTTNVAGESILSLTLFDEYYKFMVEYDDSLKTITTPAYITSNSLTIQILLGDLVGESYYHYASLYTDLSVNTLTNKFRLDYDDTSGIVENVCLNVYTLGLLGESYFNSSCSSSASGTLLVSMLPVNGTTYVGRAYYYEDGVSKFLASRTYTFPSVNFLSGVYGLLLQLLITVSVAFLVVWSIPLAAILVPLSLVVGKIIHINSFGWDAISAVIVIGFIIAYVTRKDR